MNQIQFSYHVNTAGTLCEVDFIIKDGEHTMYGPLRHMVDEEVMDDGRHVMPLNLHNMRCLKQLLQLKIDNAERQEMMDGG